MKIKVLGKSGRHFADINKKDVTKATARESVSLATVCKTTDFHSYILHFVFFCLFKLCSQFLVSILNSYVLKLSLEPFFDSRLEYRSVTNLRQANYISIIEKKYCIVPNIHLNLLLSSNQQSSM